MRKWGTEINLFKVTKRVGGRAKMVIHHHLAPVHDTESINCSNTHPPHPPTTTLCILTLVCVCVCVDMHKSMCPCGAQKTICGTLPFYHLITEIKVKLTGVVASPSLPTKPSC